MKKITEYTEQELLEISDEEIDMLVKVEMAEQGIPIYPPLEEPEYSKIPAPDLSRFRSAILSGFYFELREHAVEAAELLQALGVLTHEYEYGVVVARPFNQSYGEQRHDLGAVEPVEMYSPSKVEEHKEALDRNKRLKYEYDREKAKHEKLEAKIGAIRCAILDPIEEAKELQRSLCLYALGFCEYVRVAEGDVKMAMKFFVRANNELTGDITLQERVVSKWEEEYGAK